MTVQRAITNAPDRPHPGIPAVGRERVVTWEHFFLCGMSVPNDVGCMPWMGYVNPVTGYGQFSISGEWHRAHRLAYQLFVGGIPLDYTIDHICRNTACVNPSHLEAVTQRENVLRGIGPAAINARKTHCPRGHAYDEQNTRWSPDGRSRACRACTKASAARRYATRKATQSAVTS